MEQYFGFGRTHACSEIEWCVLQQKKIEEQNNNNQMELTMSKFMGIAP